MAFFKRAQRQENTSPESSPGGPVYDARLHPLIVAPAPGPAQRLELQSDLHHFGSSVDPATAYSHYQQPIPNPTAVALMGLASERDLLEANTMSRRMVPPFVGAELGPPVSFHGSPSTAPITGPASHLTDSAHKVESKRATRLRFGH